MKIDQLQYFVETARREHIGNAAKALRISPSAISHSIAALEDEFGKALFEKVGRQIKLTQYGKLLLDRAEFLLREINRVDEEMRADKQELRGHFRIAATHFLSSRIVTPEWFQIQNEHPRLTGTIHSQRSTEVLSKVCDGEVDLGFCFSPHPGPHHKQEILHVGKMVLAFGKKHPFLTDKRMENLSQYPATLAQTSQGIEDCENHPAFEKFHLKPRVTNLYDSYDVAIEAIKLNNSWTLIPEFIAYQFRDEIEVYVPRGWEADYKVAAVWPKFRVRTSVIDLTIERVAARLRQESVRHQRG